MRRVHGILTCGAGTNRCCAPSPQTPLQLIAQSDRRFFIPVHKSHVSSWRSG